jgi:3'(2'), 5'-bisphosphate nucleotidase
VNDAHFAVWLAEQAGTALLALRAERGFTDPAALRAEGDRRSHELLVGLIARHRPDDAVLSEEGSDDPARLAADRVWIVDPLDGTREYAEDGRVDWAVHVALWGRIGPPGPVEGELRPVEGELIAGAISLPAQNLLYGSGEPPVVPPPATGAPIRLAASRTRPPAFLHALTQRLGGVEVPMGSAGAKIAAVISGDVDAYVHAGGQYEWDSAAPVAVARAAGLHTSRIDGAPLEYNRADPRLPDLLVCRPDLATPILSAILDIQEPGTGS